MKYKLLNEPITNQPIGITIVDLAISIPFDPANTDYQAYLKWLEEGNTPEAADE